MASILYIEEAVVTGDILSRRHGDESEVYIADSAIVTPTGWDYLRQHRVQLSKGEIPISPRGSSDGEGHPSIPEVEPAQMDGSGRCELPSRSCGCQTEEFGSGYVEPSSCHDCAIFHMKRRGETRADCHGCNRRVLLDQLAESGQRVDPEQLIREVTSLVEDRLED